MSNILGAFTAITQLLNDVQPKVNLVKDPSSDIFLECHPIMGPKNKMWASVLGPFPSLEEAEGYLKAKYSRNKVRAAEHFATEGEIDHDGMAICHPQFQYRPIGASEYLARYLAQIGVTVMGGLVTLSQKEEGEYQGLTEEMKGE